MTLFILLAIVFPLHAFSFESNQCIADQSNCTNLNTANRVEYFVENFKQFESPFETPPLKPGEIEPIKWKYNGEKVADFALRLGLSSKLRHALLKFCKELGITDKFRSLQGRHPLNKGENYNFTFGEQQWFIQRPESHWNSNMHWISPANDEAQMEYLYALAEGGFDDSLKSIGEYFDFDGIVCYHLTFIAVSHCSDGFTHLDFTNANGKAFNVIIPLMIVDDKYAPELIVTAEDGAEGRLKYEYDVAAMIGDQAYHSTAGCDYRETREMRMAATIYMADVNEENVDGVMNDYTQAYPPVDREMLLRQRGLHWNREGTNNLPRRYWPSPSMVSEEERKMKDKVDGSGPSSNSLRQGEISIIPWSDNPYSAEDYRAYQIGLPPTLHQTLVDYCNEMGITKKFKSLLDLYSLYPGESQEVKLNNDMDGLKCIVKRPKPLLHSNLHAITFLNQTTKQKYLSTLAKSGLDDVMQSIKKYFIEFDVLLSHHISFFAVSHCSKAYHYTVDDGGKGFNIIIPLMLANDSAPTLELAFYPPPTEPAFYPPPVEFAFYPHSTEEHEEEKPMLLHVPYEENTGILMADYTAHSITSSCDYRDKNEMFLAAVIYVADTNEISVDNLLPNDGTTHNQEQQQQQFDQDSIITVSTTLQPGEIVPFQWKNNDADGTDEYITDYSFQLGLPKNFTDTIVAYCKSIGIFEGFQSFLGLYPLLEDEIRYLLIQDKKENEWWRWHAYRPGPDDVIGNCNTHWLSPSNERSYDHFLTLLESAEMDMLLRKIGNYFDLNTLVTYQVNIIADSHCFNAPSFNDFARTNGKAFEIIVPLILVEDNDNKDHPEIVLNGNDGYSYGLKLKYNTGIIMGDNTFYSPSDFDYREGKKQSNNMRVYASIYVADIDETNVDDILDTCYIPPKSREYLLGLNGGAPWEEVWDESD